jgi:LGFP repeat
MGSSGISAELCLCNNGNFIANVTPRSKVSRLVSAALAPIVGVMVLAAGCIGFAQNGQAQVYINDKYPIRDPGKDGNSLSPPHIAATHECSSHVYVDSFLPKATIRVYLNGTTQIGSATPHTGFWAVPLSVQLHVGDKITATQTVNGVISAASAPAVIDAMPQTLPTPTIDPKIYACGRIVPVHNLLSGVTVEVTDTTANMPIGSGSTPNLWGSDWSPVGTSSLTAGHQVTAKQTACGNRHSDPSSPATVVLPDPTPMASPKLVPPIVGNDTLTIDGVYTGSHIEAANTAVNPAADLGGGFSTSGNVWMELAQPLTAGENIVVTETLCNDTAKSPPEKPVTKLNAPVVLGPICPAQPDVKVADTTLNATLVLLKNGAVVGYGGAEPGDATLDIAPQFAFANGDKVSVVQYIGPITSPGSNIVLVNCSPQNVVTQHNDNARQGAQLHETKLTPTTVSGPNFGLLYERHVIGTLLAQPLYVHGVNVKNEIRNVIYIATAEDVVYAFDAHDTSPDTTTNVNGHNNSGNVVPLAESTKWLWRRSLGTPHVGDICGETVPPIVGITSAPVIDVSGGVMYVVARDQHDEHGMGHDYLHALDIETGHDLRNRQVGGTDPVHGFVFNDVCQRQRPGLLLQNGVVYLGYGTYTCDAGCPNNEPYRGWILGFHATDFTPAGVFTNSQSYAEGGMGVWASGNGLAGSSDGSIFYQTGNDIDSSLAELGDSFVKLHGDGKSLSMVSHYQPPAAGNYRAGDTDLGAGGPMLLPGGKLIGGGKDGMFFLLSQQDLTSGPTSFQAYFNTFHLPTPGTAGLDPSDSLIPVPYYNSPTTYAAKCPPARSYGVADEGQPCYIDVADYKNGESFGPNLHMGPVFWRHSATHGFVYKMSEKDYLKAFDYDISAGTVNAKPAAVATVRPAKDGMPGGFSSVSANGTSNGIVWTVVQQANSMFGAPQPALFYAHDATNLHELWNNDKDRAALAKFTAPTIADGYVILPSVGLFQVYGISERKRMREMVNLPLEEAISQRFDNNGGAQGLLGHPQGAVQRDSSGGFRQDFQTLVAGGGYGQVSVPPSVQIDRPMCDSKIKFAPSVAVMSSLFGSEKTGVHYVVGEIRDKFLQGGGIEKFGYPLTDEIPTPDGFGLMTRFEHGTIFWYPGRNAEVGEPQTPPLHVLPLPNHH